MKVKRTTFETEGTQEPCIIVSNDDESVQVRISTCYHYIGSDTLYLREEIDGDYNSEDEIYFPDFCDELDDITDDDAITLAKQYSAYLN